MIRKRSSSSFPMWAHMKSAFCRFAKTDESYFSSVFRLAIPILILACSAGQVLAAGVPLFELKTLERETYKLKDDLGNSAVMLFFWGTCCNTSLKQFPEMEKIYQKYKDRGLKAYAVNVDDASSASRIKPTVKRYGFQMPVLLDPTNEVFKKFSPGKIKPYVIIIGRTGDILGEFAGYKPGDETRMGEMLESALGT